jgi:hypothetical protein
MSEDIKVTAQKLKDLTSALSENSDAMDALQEAENAEELLIAMGMADAFLAGAITLNQIGEKHIQDSLLAVSDLLSEYSDDDEDEDGEDED